VIESPVQAVLDRLQGVRSHQEAGKWEARCPAHEDRKPSLGVAVGDDGRVLLHCQAGCSVEAIVGAIGLTIADLFAGEQNHNGKPRIVATYDYLDEAGVLRYQAVRFTPKDFRQRRPDGVGGWLWNLKGVSRLLYRLPELLLAAIAEPVFIVEGEKDVEALRRLGLTATCNPMGAGKWLKCYNEALRGRRVLLLPDNDEPGREHMETVLRNLEGIASSVTVLALPDLPPKGDVSDWIAAGGTKHGLLELAAAANGKPQDSNGRAHKGTQESAESESWDNPLPLGDVPEVQSFPLDVLPEPARQLVEEIAWAMNCAPDLAAVALLALVSGGIANSRHVAITKTHIVSPCLYAVVVAPPGATKSPPMRLLRRPFDLAEAQHRKEWKAAVAEWKEAEKEDRGPKPTLKRCLVSNITTESLQLTLDENPRGLLLLRNELSGLIAGLNQYKAAGDDRQFYLDLWDGTPIITDRKSDRTREGAPVFVLDAFTTIYGTIQPEVVGCLRLDRGRRRGTFINDGFLDRFLFSYPTTPDPIGEQWREVSTSARTTWENVVRELLSLAMQETPGKPVRPALLEFDGDARHAWQRFTQRLADEINDEGFPPHLRGPWAKLRSYGARLALILRCLRWAYATAGGEVDDLDEVDGESMEAAARLVDYFKSHARKIYCIIDADPRCREAKRVLRWLAYSVNSVKSVKGSKVISKRELHAGVWGGSKDVDEVSDIISLLVRYGWLRPLLMEEKKGPGRHASPQYEIHPLCFSTPSHFSQNSRNSTREPGEEG
jgi:hypothetical protein